MTMRKKIINEGGINGTGEGIVNINSKDYKGLQKAVQAHFQNRDSKDIIYYKLASIKLQMDNYLANESPKQVKSAGYFLKEFINAIGIKNKVFAQFVNIEESNLSAILNNKRKINTELAFLLGLIFNINPNSWLKIQSKNDLLKLQQTQSKIFKKYNLENLMKKAG